MTRFRLSRRMKGVLAGVAFLFSVGAVSTKLLGSRYTDFCFCSPPLAQPAFKAPDERHNDVAIAGGALPARLVAQGAALHVEAFNVVESHGGAAFAGSSVQGRALAHLGVLWGTDNHFYRRGGSSGGGSFMGGSAGAAGGGVMMGGHARTVAGDTNHATKPTSSSSRPAARPSPPAAPAAPPAAVAPPAAGLILPPTGGTFAGNADPVPGFGTGATGSTPGTTGVTLGGTPIGSGGVGSLSVTPEPATALLTLTGLFLTLFVLRRERQGQA